MKIFLQLHENHFDRIKSFKPVNAIKEMIWNSYDADANNVSINLIKAENDILKEEYVTEVIIKDDGSGINLFECKEAFECFGISSKTYRSTSKNGRRLHGQKGEGRYSIFSIGSDIKWYSVFDDEGIHKKIVISFDKNTKGRSIEISDPIITSEPIGLTISIKEVNEPANDILSKQESIIQELIKEFAPSLIAYKNFCITLNNEIINVDNNLQIKSEHEKIIGTDLVKVTIVQWKLKSESKVYYCDILGIPIEEQVIQSKSNITVYVMSKIISDLRNDISWINENMVTPECHEIKDYIQNIIDVFESELQSNNNLSIIQTMKDEGVYPISIENMDVQEKYTQNMFDSIAIEINKKMPSIRRGPKKEQRLLNKLLYETIRSNPSSLKTIISKVLDLTMEEQDNFAKILSQIELSNIIKTIDSVIQRIAFLDCLNDIIYTDKGSNIKERTEFQKMLEKELWIFGEQYLVSVSDRSIKNVLEKYISIFERSKLEFGDLVNGELIPDICLFSTKAEGESDFEHLVVEIKKPSKILTQNEVNQIEKYAHTISTQHQFNHNGHKWTFILLGKGLSDEIKFKMQSRKNGILIENNNVVVKVLVWDEIIRKTKRQYEYFKDKLQLQISNDFVDNDIKNRLEEINSR